MRVDRRRPPFVAPILLGVLVLAATTGVGHAQHLAVSWVGYLLLVAPILVLPWRHRYPLTVFLLVAPLTLAYYLSGEPGGPAALYPVLALVVLAALRGVPVAATAAGTVLAAAVVVGLLTHHEVWFDGRAAFAVGWAAAAIAAGALGAARRGAVQARREQAVERTRRLAEQERLRIAREVHDVVAHSLAMINVQAGVGAHVADRRPDQAKEALLAIKEASRAALADLRATLDVVRSGEDRAPTPSLARLPELVDGAAAAGFTVRADPVPADLPAPVDTAAYRIVQESITNVVRHAVGATSVDIAFEQSPEMVTVTVTDDGSGSADPGSGNGLRGMRERAQALGGECTAGRVDGGYRVRAELPIRGGTP